MYSVNESVCHTLCQILSFTNLKNKYVYEQKIVYGLLPWSIQVLIQIDTTNLIHDINLFGSEKMSVVWIFYCEGIMGILSW